VIIDNPRDHKFVRNGDVLRCSSDGNPLPRYKWIDILTNRTREGPEWTVTAADICNGDNPYILVLQCTATITVLGKELSSRGNKTFSVTNETCLMSTGEPIC